MLGLLLIGWSYYGALRDAPGRAVPSVTSQTSRITSQLQGRRWNTSRALLPERPAWKTFKTAEEARAATGAGETKKKMDEAPATPVRPEQRPSTRRLEQQRTRSRTCENKDEGGRLDRGGWHRLRHHELRQEPPRLDGRRHDVDSLGDRARARHGMQRGVPRAPHARPAAPHAAGLRDRPPGGVARRRDPPRPATNLGKSLGEDPQIEDGGGLRPARGPAPPHLPVIRSAPVRGARGRASARARAPC